MGKSDNLFERAKEVIPGGVNSPVRAFGSVGMTPRFISHAKGARIYDADGNESATTTAAEPASQLKQKEPTEQTSVSFGVPAITLRQSGQ